MRRRTGRVAVRPAQRAGVAEADELVVLDPAVVHKLAADGRLDLVDGIDQRAGDVGQRVVGDQGERAVGGVADGAEAHGRLAGAVGHAVAQDGPPPALGPDEVGPQVSVAVDRAVLHQHPVGPAVAVDGGGDVDEAAPQHQAVGAAQSDGVGAVLLEARGGNAGEGDVADGQPAVVGADHRLARQTGPEQLRRAAGAAHERRAGGGDDSGVERRDARRQPRGAARPEDRPQLRLPGDRLGLRRGRDDRLGVQAAVEGDRVNARPLVDVGGVETVERVVGRAGVAEGPAEEAQVRVENQRGRRNADVDGLAGGGAEQQLRRPVDSLERRPAPAPAGNDHHVGLGGGRGEPREAQHEHRQGERLRTAVRHRRGARDGKPTGRGEQTVVAESPPTQGRGGRGSITMLRPFGRPTGRGGRSSGFAAGGPRGVVRGPKTGVGAGGP